MFCDACGSQIVPGQGYCTRCGKQIVGPVSPLLGRVARHTQILGILWIAYSAMAVIGGFVVMLIGNVVFGNLDRFSHGMGPPPPAFLHPLLHFIGFALLAKGALGVVTGIGLMQRASWARMLAIVLGCLAMLSIPLGMALGIYTLWVLLSANADVEYAALSQAAGA